MSSMVKSHPLKHKRYCWENNEMTFSKNSLPNLYFHSYHTKYIIFLFLILYFLLLSLSCGPVYSVLRNHSSMLTTKIDEILSDSLLNRGMVGIRIISAETGKLLYEKNSDKLFPPASNMKLITTAGALLSLKPEYRFRTIILKDGKLNGDTLKGNLLLKGYGDPMIDVETLSQFARILKRKGIHIILGNIVFDDSYFDTVPYGKGWMWDDLKYDFSAPISGLSLNKNTYSIYLKPGANKQDPVIVNVFPTTRFIEIKNYALTAEEDNISLTTNFSNGHNVVIIKGTLSIHSSPRQFTCPVKKPALYTATVFAEKLREIGIEINGKIKKISNENFTDTLFIHYSEPLFKMLYDMDKQSSNFIAETVLKTIGAEIASAPGTTDKGIKEIEKFLKEKKIIKRKFLEKDGSGLSRYNLITPHQITSLLFYMYHKFEFAPEFLTVLPTGGIDGTLRRRMKEGILKRKVRAKTGTMTGISTLSGYCITNNGKVLIFSIMMKDYIATPSHIRNIQDKLLRTLTTAGVGP